MLLKMMNANAPLGINSTFRKSEMKQKQDYFEDISFGQMKMF
jgi:hypothetical protein